MNVKVMLEYIKAAPKVFILVGCLLMANVGLFLYASVFQQRDIEALQNSWSQKRDAVSGRGASDVAAIYSQGENDLKAWRARILPKKNFARFVGSLFDTAAHNSLTNRGVAYKVTNLKNDGLIAYTMDLNVTGKYAGIKSFIADLGRKSEILTIDNVSLSNTDATGDAVDLKLTLTVYLRPEEQ